MSTRNPPERYCPTCDAEQQVIETVPWQEDLCSECRSTIPESSSPTG